MGKRVGVGVGAELGEIPATERGYDGGDAGVTEGEECGQSGRGAAGGGG